MKTMTKDVERLRALLASLEMFSETVPSLRKQAQAQGKASGRVPSDDYNVTESGPTSAFTRAVDKKAAGGTDFAEAMDETARQFPHLLAEHEAWCAAVADGDARRLPAHLRAKCRAVRLRLKEAEKAQAEPADGDDFSSAVDALAESYQAGGMSEMDAIARAQDEVFNRSTPSERRAVLS